MENILGYLRLLPIRFRIVLREFFRPYAALFRLRKRKEYGRFYDTVVERFPVGSSVRTKQKRKETPVILLSPSIQELGFLTTGQANEEGYKKMRDARSSEGSLAYSLYEKYETWVVVRYNESRDEFIDRIVWCGVSFSLEDEAVPVLIRPGEEVHIAWPHDYGYGKNIVMVDSGIIERVE